MLAESSMLYFIFSLRSLCYGDVYRHESGSCRTFPFFLTFFIITKKLLPKMKSSPEEKRTETYRNFILVGGN